MKAAVLNAIPGGLEIEDVESGEPGPREVLITTKAAGLCHSDLHYMEGKHPYPCPAVLGHESAGVVEAPTAGAASSASGCAGAFAFGAGATGFGPDTEPVLSQLSMFALADDAAHFGRSRGASDGSYEASDARRANRSKY